MIPSAAVSILTPTKLNQIPSSPKLQSEPRMMTGKISAVDTDIQVAKTGFSIALRKPCVVTPNHLNRYAKQNSLIARVDSSSSIASSALTNREAITSGKKNRIDVDTRPTIAVPIYAHLTILLTLS